MYESIPLIRLEIEGMKRMVTTALLKHQALMDEQIRKAVDEYCEPENINRIIEDAARKALHDAIKAEVHEFFWRGEGRRAVAEAVKTSLINRETYTPLDDVDTQPIEA